MATAAQNILRFSVSPPVLLTLARFVGAGFGFVAQLLVARCLGPEQLGQFYLITSVIVVFGAAATLGYGGIANRLFVRYNSRNDTLSLESFCSQAWRETLVASVLAAIPFVILTRLAGIEVSLLLVVAAVAGMIGLSMLRTNGGFANALKLFELANLPDNLMRPTIFMIGAFVLVTVAKEPAVLEFVVWFSLAGVAAAALQAAVLAKTLAGGGNDYNVWRALKNTRSSRQAGHWRGSGTRLVGPLLVASLFSDIVILTASLFLTSEDLGLLGLSLKIAFLVGYPIQVAHQVATPIIAEHLRHSNPAKIAGEVSKTNVVTIASSVCGLVIAALFGDHLLSLFGAGFEAGYWTLIVVMLAQLARAVAGPAMPALIAAGKHAESQIVHLFVPAILALTMLLLGSAWGHVGAALSVLISICVTGLWLATICYKSTGIRCDAFNVRSSILNF